MANSVDAVEGFRAPLRAKKAKRSETAGLSFPAGAAIAAAGVVAASLAVAAFVPFHGSKAGSNPDGLRLTVADLDASTVSGMQSDARTIRAEKSPRLYPYVANNVVSHADKPYQIPPREAVASVNVPVLPQKKEIFAMADTKNLLRAAPAQVAEAPKPQPDPIQVASIDAPDVAQDRFNLVMPQTPSFEAPLPMARPEGWPKAPTPPVAAKEPAPKQALAYASPEVDQEDSGLPPRAAAPKMQAGVAIYDISARTVYMPDGTRFEAHSGLGQFRDNPKFKTLKGKGPTPPNTYRLSMRESPFHGVPALRMTPQDESKMYGRGGILTHTYLRRRPGDSAGCIAFKDYYKFLKYYQRGQVHTIVVVESMGNDAPRKKSVLASLFGG